MAKNKFMRIEVDLRKEMCAYVDVEALDNGILALDAIWHFDEAEWKKIPKEILAKIKESIKELDSVMIKIQAQFSEEELDGLLSGDRYNKPFAV